METMYTMKQACELTGMNYEALKFYCNSELVPAVGRDGRNHRIFDDQAIAWIIGLNCLKRCGLSIKEMQHYTKLCQEGDSTIAQRKEILVQKRAVLEQRLTEIQGDIDYIDKKQQYYDILLAGETPSPGILAGLRRRPDSAPRQ